MGLVFSDAGRQTVARYLGSSFDHFTFDGDAEHMVIDQRWKAYHRSELFVQLRGDASLMALVAEIYADEPAVLEAMDA